jgi:hypothetical protein
VVIALAGRRIDAADAPTPRFPLQSVALVEQRLAELFRREAATALVCSAACGADLVALAVAGKARMRRRVVLPFDHETFLTTSVTDRPGAWEGVYRRVLAELEPTGDVITMLGAGRGSEAYAAANETILRLAVLLGRESGTGTLAVLVWEGGPRGGDDMTAAFAEGARQHGLRVAEVLTR